MQARKLKPTKLMAIDPWGALDSLNREMQEPEGPEWFSVEEFAKRYGLSIEGARRRLRSLEDKGIVGSWRGLGKSRRVETKFRAV